MNREERLSNIKNRLVEVLGEYITQQLGEEQLDELSEALLDEYVLCQGAGNMLITLSLAPTPAGDHWVLEERKNIL